MVEIVKFFFLKDNTRKLGVVVERIIISWIAKQGIKAGARNLKRAFGVCGPKKLVQA